MPFKNSIIIKTEDYSFAKELIKTKIQDCDIGPYQTRAAETLPVAQIIVEFLSDAAIAAFGAWLGAYFATQKGADKTTINDRQITQHIVNINIFIKQELEKQKRQIENTENE